VFRDTGTFNPSWRTFDDYDMYLRIAREFPISCHHATVLEHVCRDTDASRNPALLLRQVRAVLHSQRAFVRSRPAAREAYLAGLRFNREQLGGQLALSVESALRRRDWKTAIGESLELLHYYPEGFWKGGGLRSARARQ